MTAAAIVGRGGRRRPWIALAAMAAGLAVVAVASIGVGAVGMPPSQVVRSLFAGLGLAQGDHLSAGHELILWSIRLPRLMLGLLVGASLAMAGALMQGLFRNALADPGLIGISSGAALAAAAVIVLGVRALPSAAAPHALAIGAFLGGLASTAVVFQIARAASAGGTATLLLAGIAVNALCLTGVGLLVFISDDQQMRTLTFWTMGSLGAATWSTVAAIAPILIAALGLATLLARPMNVYLLGEAEAGHTGIDVRRLRRWAVVLAALLVGTGVAVTGMIGFVGLVVPHVVRLLLGPDHRGLLPGAALLGAGLLVAADMVARTIVAPAELPVGLVTSAIGAPFFILLLTRRAASGGL